MEEKVNEIMVMSVGMRNDLMSHLFDSTLLYDNYNISVFAKWLHSLPHIDIRLHYLKNTTFNPNDNQYLESLGILVAIPGFWLILTLLFFLIFFLCRCCDANNKKKRKLTLCKCCLFFFAVVSAFILVVGMFGSVVTHLGLKEVQNKTEDMSAMIESIKILTKDMSDVFKSSFDPELDDLKSLFEDNRLVLTSSDRTHLIKEWTSSKQNVSKTERILDDINTKFQKLSIKPIPEFLHQLETIRWPTTFALLGALVLICFILIWGIIRHSRCVLILFSVLGLLSLVVCWVITSVYLGVSVAGSDFCIDPQPFLSEQFNSAIDEKVFDYYISCQSMGPLKSPFDPNFDQLAEALDWTKRLNEEMTHYCKTPSVGSSQLRCKNKRVLDQIYKIHEEFNRVERLLHSLKQSVDCQRFHEDYIQLMTASCKEVLEGVVLMLLSSTAAGLGFTVLVLCASHTWINIRKKRPLIADQTEETDPFLPPASSTSTTSSANSKRIRDSYGSAGSGRPRFSHTPPQTPHFPPPTSTPPANGRTIGRDDQLSFLSPPPAYEQLGHNQLLHSQMGHSQVGHSQIGHNQLGHNQLGHNQLGHQMGHQMGGHSQHSHQAVGPHYVADTDLLMRATQATKF